MAMLNIQEKDGAVTFEVRVIPRASRSEIVGEHGGALKVKLTSPPVEGAANEKLISLLSTQLHVARTDIAIISGQTSKTKRIRISGINTNRLREALPK